MSPQHPNIPPIVEDPNISPIVEEPIGSNNQQDVEEPVDLDISRIVEEQKKKILIFHQLLGANKS